MIRLYDTLTRRKQDLDAVTGKKPGETVKLYTCGPTVYHFAHIGNLRTYIWEDVLERTLQMEGYQVDRVMNITDVGHLTSDADAGEDKMDKAVAREGRSAEEIIVFYQNAFLKDCAALNIRIPAKLPRASHYIKAQQDLIQALFEKGFAYDTPEAVYFDVSKFPNYGALTGQRLEEKEVAARAEVVAGENKRQPQDFALWFKLAGRFEHHVQHWPSPWGEGFPGWHLECSALIHEFLGEPIDIHTGGVDHIGTHHTNEIAQSESAYEVPLAHLWMHGEHLLLNNAKMAKSSGNGGVLQDILDRGFDPLAFRYLCLNAHYRTKMNFTWESLEAASQGLANLRSAYAAIRAEGRRDHSLEERMLLLKDAAPELQEFHGALQDDLNTSQALAVVHATLGSKALSAETKYALLGLYDEILGLDLEHAAAAKEAVVIPPEVLELVAAREEARRNKQFIQADELRERISGLGYTVDDAPGGPVVSPK